MRHHHARNGRNDRLGAVLVETAIVMPVFLVVLWGILEFGRAMMVGQLTTNAARYGARAAILDGSTNSTITDDVKNFLVKTVSGISPDDVTVEIAVTPGPGNQNPQNQLSASRPRDICQVSVSIPYERVAYFSPRFLKNATLRGMCAMHHE